MIISSITLIFTMILCKILKKITQLVRSLKVIVCAWGRLEVDLLCIHINVIINQVEKNKQYADFSMTYIPKKTTHYYPSFSP